jgi:probable phosphoglycerate mutase
VTSAVPEASPEPPFSVRDPFFINDSGVTHLTLVRHAQQAYPHEDVFDHTAWDDPQLSQLGHTQAHAVAALLGEQPVQAVYCSTMSRARQTAEMIASTHGLPVIPVADLREVDSYRDLPDDVAPTDVIDAQEWQERQDRYRVERRWDLIPFSEPSVDFRARVLAAVREIVDRHPGERIVIICHGGVINAVIADALGLDEDLFFLPYHASLSTLVDKDGVRRLFSVNEHRHLHPGILTN